MLLSLLTDRNFMIRVLAERSATVFFTDAAETPSPVWSVRFSLDNKYIAAGNHTTTVADFSSLDVTNLVKHLRYGKLIENEYVPSSNMASVFPIFLQTAVSLLPSTTTRFAC